MSIYRFLIGSLVSALLAASSGAAFAVTPEEAASVVGTTATVEGMVSQVAEHRGTIFINMGGRYPNQSFHAVIFDDNAGLFPGIAAIEGEMVAIHGLVELYKGRPEIIVTSPDQIEKR
ncbi:nucleotide-binding protein [Cereibacter sphaeroides]|uniref:nucleotide-binding protein n=1 Tax=Cereibacter sphaeroides TaxID=1063 RepID=UPI001F401218|nr:nucleotide-binding protein [Cereibacter sphaeroides]MCE6957678.1 nucleotide-binding protein [Cereibacter sphaeroides]MCE6971402.1 nucleotide-binding protein [Cereibacter sphaeroides]